MTWRRWLLILAMSFALGHFATSIAAAQPDGGRTGEGGDGGGGGGRKGFGDPSDIAIGVLFAFSFLACFVKTIFEHRKSKRLLTLKEGPLAIKKSPPEVPSDQMEVLLRDDPDFSRIAFLDFVHSLWQETLQSVGQPEFERLSPYYSEDMLNFLREDTPMPPGGRIVEVIIRGIRIADIVQSRGLQEDGRDPGLRFRVIVELESNWRLRGPESEVKNLYQEVTLEFERSGGVRSKPPEQLSEVHCQSCGGTLPHERLGERCPHCGQDYGSPLFNWQCTRILRATEEETRFSSEILLEPLIEPGFRLPGRFATTLADLLAKLEREEPEFRSRLGRRAAEVFDGLFGCWNTNDLEGMRPFSTERLLGSYQYWIEGYREAGLRNELRDWKILSMELARIERDNWFDAVTVRLKASSFDATVAVETGLLRAGSMKFPRFFCEYWTFTRRRGQKGEGPGACPSCGASWTPSGEKAFCSHCGSRLVETTATWELAIIEQADSYRFGVSRPPDDDSSWRRLRA